MSGDIVFHQERHIGIVTLARPQALNALTLEMIRALQAQLDVWALCADVHAVVVRAVEGRAFCAGGDVRWLFDNRSMPDKQMSFFSEEYRLNQTIAHYPKPYIPLLSGLTMGGGVGISLHGSHPVATERFVFAMPETTIGFFPDVGASYLLARCPSFLGVYLGLTGRRLNAADAHCAGLVKFVVQDAMLTQILSDLMMSDLSEQPFNRVSDCLSHYAQKADLDAFDVLCNFTKRHFNFDNVSEILTSLQSDQGLAALIYAELLQKSPLSLALSLSQIRQAAHLTVDACLAVDSVLVRHFMAGHDFYEGVRALLIDKDQSPKWQYESIDKVDKVLLKHYFDAAI